MIFLLGGLHVLIPCLFLPALPTNLFRRRTFWLNTSAFAEIRPLQQLVEIFLGILHGGLVVSCFPHDKLSIDFTFAKLRHNRTKCVIIS